MSFDCSDARLLDDRCERDLVAGFPPGLLFVDFFLAICTDPASRNRSPESSSPTPQHINDASSVLRRRNSKLRHHSTEIPDDTSTSKFLPPIQRAPPHTIGRKTKLDQ